MTSPTPSSSDSERQITFNQFRHLVMNASSMRSRILRGLLDPRRDVYDECGYPDKDAEITPKDYRRLYDREGIATRVVSVLPNESWKAQPLIFETEELDSETAFEKDLRELTDTLRGESHYKRHEGNPLFEALKRVDVLSGIGRFGLLYFGIDDGEDPATEVSKSSGRRKLLYLRVFDESQIHISKFDEDPTSPRYGHPELYQVHIQNAENISTAKTRILHWTRCLHVADNLMSSEIFGVPRMQPVYNRLYDLMKLYGGSAEMYWRGAFPGLSIETHPSLGGDVEIDLPSVRDNMENYMNGLQRYLAFSGLSAKSLAPQVVDPSPQIEVQLTAICILLGIPQRIFCGSERGNLASGQDDSTWNERLAYRRNLYLTPRLIVPFLDRAIALGLLAAPKKETGYTVVWPDLEALSEEEKANVANLHTDAIIKYINGGGENLITPEDFLRRILSMDPELVAEIMKNAESHIVQLDQGLIEQTGRMPGDRETDDQTKETPGADNDRNETGE